MSYGELRFGDEVDEAGSEHCVVVAVAAEAVQETTPLRAWRRRRGRPANMRGASTRARRPRASASPGFESSRPSLLISQLPLGPPKNFL